MKGGEGGENTPGRTEVLCKGVKPQGGSGQQEVECVESPGEDTGEGGSSQNREGLRAQRRI